MKNRNLKVARKYNLKKDPRDPRDLIVSQSTKLMATGPLPPLVDLDASFGPIKDQGQIGSCQSEATSEVREFLYRKYNSLEKDKAISIDNFITSPLFFYYMVREAEGTTNEDNGGYLSTCVKVMNKVGICLEKTDPYVTSNFKVAPAEIDVLEASKYTCSSYHRITGGSKEMKAVLAKGYPIIMGMVLYASFEDDYTSRTGIVLLPNKNKEQQLGGHATVIQGYDDSKHHFICRNSWGTEWGDKGKYYLPYQMMDDPDILLDAWVISTTPLDPITDTENEVLDEAVDAPHKE